MQTDNYFSIYNKNNELDFFYFGDKKILITSFFNSKTINKDVAYYQKQIFDKFSIKLNQFDDDIRHPDFMNYVMNNIDSDIYIFFDIDSIPLHNKVIIDALKLINDCSILGVAQCDNSNGLNHIYAAPSFLGLTKILYNNLFKPSFVERQRYISNYDGTINKTIDLLYAHNIENIGLSERFYNISMQISKNLNIKLICDTAEELSYLCEEFGYKINLMYPSSSDNNTWKLGNSDFMFGNGTVYENNIYHAFQIRNESNRFIKKCMEIIEL